MDDTKSEKIWKCTRCNYTNNVMEILQKGDNSCLNCHFPVPDQKENDIEERKLNEEPKKIKRRNKTSFNIFGRGLSLPNILQSATSTAVSDTPLHENDSKYDSIYTDPDNIMFKHIKREDIKFKWKNSTKHIRDCDHNHFLYVVSKTIDDISSQENESNEVRIIINKPIILMYLHEINADGERFEHSQIEFVKNVKKIIFDTSKINNLPIHSLKHQYAEELYQRIYKYNITSLKIKKSQNKTILFHSKYGHFTNKLKDTVSDLITTLTQYHLTPYLQKHISTITNKLNKCNDELGTILAKEWKHNNLKNTVCEWDHRRQQLEECNLLNMLYILDCILLNEKFKNDVQEQLYLENYASKIMQYFKIEHIDGVKFKFYSRDEFTSRIQEYVDAETRNNTHIYGELATLYDLIANVDIFKITAFYIKNNLKWDRLKSIESLEKCSLQDMICVIIYIFSNKPHSKLIDNISNSSRHSRSESRPVATHGKLGMFKLDQYKDKIIEYFVLNRINGYVFCSWSKDEFLDKLAEFIKYNSNEKVALIKFYYKIDNFDFQNVSDIHINDGAVNNDMNDEVAPWFARTNFKDVHRVGYAFDDGIIGVADVMTTSDEITTKIQLRIGNSEPFWVTVPNDKICEATQAIVQQSHLRMFDKWILRLQIKNELTLPFDHEPFKEMLLISDAHPQLLFTLLYSNYAVKLENKTYDNILQSFIGSSLSETCANNRCQGKHKLNCYCNVNQFPNYTYFMIMVIMTHKQNKHSMPEILVLTEYLMQIMQDPITANSIARLIVQFADSSILNFIKNNRNNTSGISEKMCSLLPSDMRNDTYFNTYKTFIQQWLLHDFYNIICSHCGGVNKSIMINRIFNYSSTLRNCRTCGVIVRKRDDTIKSNSPPKPSTASIVDSISWSCKSIFNVEHIDVNKLQHALMTCCYKDNISNKYDEQDLLRLLKKLLTEKFELTYYLNRFWDDIDEWKV
eukprot:446280_1